MLLDHRWTLDPHMSTIVSTFLCESVRIIGSMTFKLVLLIIFKRTLNLRSKSHRLLVSTFLCESMRIIGSMKFKLVLNIIFKCTMWVWEDYLVRCKWKQIVTFRLHSLSSVQEYMLWAHSMVRKPIGWEDCSLAKRERMRLGYIGLQDFW